MPRAFLVHAEDAQDQCDEQPQTQAARSRVRYAAVDRRMPLSEAVLRCTVHWFNMAQIEAQV